MRAENQSTPVTERCSSCGVSRNIGDRCEYCGALYPDMINAKSTGKKLKSLDRKYSVERRGGRTEISWSWRSATTWLGIPFFLFWNSVAFSFASVSEMLSDPLTVFPIPGLHILIGIVGSVYVGVCLINKSTIIADNSQLALRHHPVPWPGHAKFKANEIEGIFVSKGQRSRKNSSWDVPILQLVTKAGTRHQLLKGKTEVEFADYETLRRHLLDALNIEPSQADGAV